MNPTATVGYVITFHGFDGSIRDIVGPFVSQDDAYRWVNDQQRGKGLSNVLSNVYEVHACNSAIAMAGAMTTRERG